MKEQSKLNLKPNLNILNRLQVLGLTSNAQQVTNEKQNFKNHWNLQIRKQ